MLATSAETMMLTSSQLRLSFVIAAAHNRPLDFFDRISELWPIIGSAYGFRGVSRHLVKKVPHFAPGLKASIAFSGTFAIGEASRLYYEYGQPTSDEVRRELIRRSHEEGAKEAQRLFRKVLSGQSLESLEEEAEGSEISDLVEKLTRPGKEASPVRSEGIGDEPEDVLEPTVEMDAVVDLAPPSGASEEETSVSAEPKDEAKAKAKDEAKAKAKDEAKPKDEAKAKDEGKAKDEAKSKDEGKAKDEAKDEAKSKAEPSAKSQKSKNAADKPKRRKKRSAKSKKTTASSEGSSSPDKADSSSKKRTRRKPKKKKD